MLLMPIVAAAVSDTSDAPGVGGLLPAGTPKAQIDAGQLDADALGSPTDDKVELDLEDAPFLLGEETAPPPSVPAQSPALSPESDTPPKKTFSLAGLLANKKLLLAVAVVLLLLVGGAAWLLLRTKEPPQSAATPAVQTVVVPQQAEPSPGPAEPPQIILSWEPFWVEQKDAKGTIRLLVVKFSAPTKNRNLMFEAEAKKIIVRDAVYYYLKNKSLTFLTDAANAETLKKDVLAIMNEYHSGGKLEDLLIENYLVK